MEKEVTMGRDPHTPNHARPRSGQRWTPLALAGLAVVGMPLLGRLVRALYGLASGGGPRFPSPAMVGVLAAVVLGGTGLIVGIRELQRGDRTWPLWLGTAACGLVLAFWVAFAVAEVVNPH